ncbi:MAG: transglutaminase-like domain-containing protein [Planctomycetota bacterium]|nr:transglutaminase-like domain-containing protein [Planctomycetota bacterium]
MIATRCCAGLLLGLLVLPARAADPELDAREAPSGKRARSFTFTYQAFVKEVPAGAKKLKLWIPVPRSDAHQTIGNVKIAPEARRIELEEESGNRMAYWEFKDEDLKPVTVTMTFDCERREIAARDLALDRPLSPRELDGLKEYLEAHEKVPVGGEFKDLALKAVGGAKSPLEQTKAAYDFVFANMKYGKPEGKAWGQGDTWYACREGVGNCTDFHALFMSIGRSVGIPVKFEMGFPLPPPEDAKEGAIGGYHCWAKFYLGGIGWVPVDISEARKHEDLAAYYYGNLSADRVSFSTGRDLKLKPGQDAGRLNFFIYPYAEADGKPLKVDKAFSFKDIH